MHFNYQVINCQNPFNPNNINRAYRVIRCEFLRNHPSSSIYIKSL